MYDAAFEGAHGLKFNRFSCGLYFACDVEGEVFKRFFAALAVVFCIKGYI